MTKTNKQINKEATVNDTDSSFAVVAYRTAQLELTQKEGFKALNDKLDGIVNGFVTEKEMVEAKQESNLEHKRLWGAIEDIRKASRWWVGTILTAIAGIAALVMAVKK